MIRVNFNIFYSILCKKNFFLILFWCVQNINKFSWVKVHNSNFFEMVWSWNWRRSTARRDVWVFCNLIMKYTHKQQQNVTSISINLTQTHNYFQLNLNWIIIGLINQILEVVLKHPQRFDYSCCIHFFLSNCDI